MSIDSQVAKDMHPLVSQVERFLQGMDCSDGMVVAVSGGPDSVALLRALHAVPGTPLPLLVVAHLNHQLRGAESDADEAFVRRLPTAMTPPGKTKLVLRCDKLDVAARAKAEHDNLEKVARKVRYAWLAQVAKEYGVRLVAAGHTADDQAETVLHRLLRGAGLRGLRGIAARRELTPDVALIRPLLAVTRAEVLAYLSEEGQEYCQDRSNLDVRFTRNRIRHELLPLLTERYNPAIVSLLCRLAQQAGTTYRGMESAARRLLAAAERPRAGRWVVLDRESLARVRRNLIRETFRLVWQRERWPMNGMSFAAWDRLASLALGDLPSIDLPGGLRACCRERVVQVGPVP